MVTPFTREGYRQVESEVLTQFGRAQLIKAVWNAPLDFVTDSPHHFLQLSLLPQPNSGRVRFTQGSRSDRFTAVGEMFFCPAGQSIHVRAHCDMQRAITFTFDPAVAAQYLDQAMDWTEGRLLAGLDLGSSTLRTLLFRLGAEMKRPGFASDTFVELIAGQVLLELSRHLQDRGLDDERGGLPPWRLRLIDERLRDGEDAPTLAELATLCQLSVRHLTRAFRASTGRSIGDHIAERRMEHAKALLSSCHSVKSVARQMGFNSPNNFSTAFRRTSGESPRQYLERSRRQASR